MSDEKIEMLRSILKVNNHEVLVKGIKKVIWDKRPAIISLAWWLAIFVYVTLLMSFMGGSGYSSHILSKIFVFGILLFSVIQAIYKRSWFMLYWKSWWL